MSRKKTRTPASSNTLQILETEFKQTPAKLANHLSKDLGILKQKENQLKTTLQKTQAQLKTTQARLTKTAKNKTTATGKKQHLAAQKTFKENNKAITTLTKQLQEVTKLAKTTKLKQARIVALRKHLAEFDKIWAKQVAQLAKKVAAKPKAKAKNKPKAKRKVRATSPKTQQPSNSTQPHSQVETYDDSLENTRHNEILEEVAS